MTEEMKKIINSEENHIVVQAKAGCVDYLTEFYNGHGWKSIRDYKSNEKVLIFNKDWTSSLVVPSNYIKESCDYFYQTKTLNLDMCLSDEHRVIYVSNDVRGDKNKTSQSFKKFHLKEKTMKEVYESHMKTKLGFYGKIPTSFDGFKVKKCELPLNDEQFKLCTLIVLSEGFSCSESFKIRLTKTIRMNMLEKLLNDLYIKYRKVREPHKDIYTYIFDFKEFRFFKSDCLMKLSKKEKLMFLETMEKFRGLRGMNNELRIFIHDKKVADFIQLLTHSVKKRCIICKYTNNDYYTLIIRDRIYLGLSHSVKDKKEKIITKVKSEDGYKYCFTVPSGMLILRRNNKIFITGNSGKSSTLVEYIKSRPNESILFLVYNKEMQSDFSSRVRGIRNCEVKTIHSLAYRWYVKKYGKKRFKNVSVVDIKFKLKNKSLEFAELSKILKYFNEFLCSDVEKAKELIEHDFGDKIYFKYVQQLWNYFSSKNPEFISHNCYLKLFQLSKPKLNYDTLLVDETNDVNSCMLDVVINNLDKKVIVVGDSLQNLNSFNYTVDGLAIMRDKYGFKEYPLTQSFRVSNKVADIASRYLTYMYERPIKFTGVSNTRFGKLYLRDAEKYNKINLLCRTRLGALQEILTMLDCNIHKKVYFVGGLDSFGIKVLEKLIQFNGFLFISGEKFHITELRKWIKDGLEDSEIESKVNLYNFYTKNKNCIEQLRDCEVSKKEDAEIIVQTAHSSKGATMKNVKLANDFLSIENLKSDKEFLENKVYTEKKPMYTYKMRMKYSDINLIYVALTRATGIIDMGQTLKKKEKRDDYVIEEEDSEGKGDTMNDKLERVKTIQNKLRELKNRRVSK